MELLPATSDSPLIGRQRELAALWSQYALASAGHLRVVLIAGMPGIGKTRLLNAIAAQATHEGALVLQGGASDAEGMPPYLPFLEALGRYIRGAEPETLRAQTGPLASILVAILPELAARLGELPASYPLPPEQARLRLYEAVGLFVAAIAERQPLLLILDDLQWADPSSLDLLAYLARHQPAARLCVLGAYREGEIAHPAAFQRTVAELHRLRALTPVPLAPLASAEVAALAATSLGAPLDSVGAQRLYTHSEGNPFFAEELLRDWIERGALVQTGQGWTLNPLDAPALPASIVGAVRQRLIRLPSEVVELLHSAAIVGRTFDAALLAAVVGQDSDTVEERLRVAAQAALLRSDQGGRFSFSHDTIRECLYADVSPLRRRRLHGFIGRALETQPEPAGAHRLAELAFHFARSGDRARGAAYALRAAAQAMQAYAHDEALAHYRTALDLFDRADPRRGEVLLALGQAAALASAHQDAINSFEAAQVWFAQAGDPVAAARAAHALGKAHWQREAIAEARSAFEGAASLLAGRSLPETVALLVDLSSLLTLSLHEQAAGRRVAQQARDLARQLGDARLIAAASRALGNLLARANDLDAGLALLEQALALAAANDDPLEAAECCACLRIVCAWNGEVQRAIGYGQQEIAFARRCHIPALLRHTYTQQAVLHIFSGRLVEGERLLAEAQAVLERLDSPEALAYFRFVKSLIPWTRGEYAVAEQGAMEAIAAFRRLNPHSVVWYLGPLAMSQARQGNRQEAQAYLAEIEAFAANLPDNSMPAAYAFSALATTALLLDDRERLFRLYPRLLPFRGRDCDLLVDRLLGEIETVRGDFVAASTSLASAETLARREESTWELAHVLLAQANLALARGGAGSAELARQRLAEAQALFAHFGNRTEVERIQRRLDRLSPRPARPSLPAGLSAREAEVLGLVAAGKSNREIAQALALSEKTIEKHITSIYGKIGAANRAAATAFAIHNGLL